MKSLYEKRQKIFLILSLFKTESLGKERMEVKSSLTFLGTKRGKKRKLGLYGVDVYFIWL